MNMRQLVNGHFGVTILTARIEYLSSDGRSSNLGCCNLVTPIFLAAFRTQSARLLFPVLPSGTACLLSSTNHSYLSAYFRNTSKCIAQLVLPRHICVCWMLECVHGAMELSMCPGLPAAIHESESLCRVGQFFREEFYGRMFFPAQALIHFTGRPSVVTFNSLPL